MQDRQQGLINTDFEGIPQITRSQFAACNKAWGPEFYFFGCTSLSDTLIDTITKIKVIQETGNRCPQRRLP